MNGGKFSYKEIEIGGKMDSTTSFKKNDWETLAVCIGLLINPVKRIYFQIQSLHLR